MMESKGLQLSVCNMSEFPPMVFVSMNGHGLDDRETRLRVLEVLDDLYWNDAEDIVLCAPEFQIWAHELLRDGAILVNPEGLYDCFSEILMPKKLTVLLKELLTNEGFRQYQFCIRNREMVVKRALELAGEK